MYSILMFRKENNEVKVEKLEFFSYVIALDNYYKVLLADEKKKKYENIILKDELSVLENRNGGFALGY